MPESAGSKSAVRTIGSSPNGGQVMQPLASFQAEGNRFTLYARQSNGKISMFSAIIDSGEVISLSWQTYNNESVSHSAVNRSLPEETLMRLFSGKDFDV
tara:strand:+ start:113861 stop:114157 length:297 start_codon:yes stop_codon:yes gene_type:complete